MSNTVNYNVAVPRSLHSELEILKSHRSLRAQKTVYMRDLYIEALKEGVKVLKEKNRKEGLK